jgi:GntR family transcriptional regulator, transcriptional repressor for pyruvate dehydrogenase complex
MAQSVLGDRGIQAFRPVRVRSAADEVLAVLADAIRGGLYQPGDALPRERDLADRLGVSRAVVREAIAALRQAEIVTVRRGHNGGTVVGSLANLPQVLARIAGETRYEFRALLEARRGLELQSALLASGRIDAGGLARLRALVDELPDLIGSDAEFYEADVRFHLTLGELSGNAMLAGFIREVFNRIAVLRESFPHAHVDFDLAVRNQRVLLAAIESRDPLRIARTIDDHLKAFEQVILGRELTYMRGLWPDEGTTAARQPTSQGDG